MLKYILSVRYIFSNFNPIFLINRKPTNLETNENLTRNKHSDECFVTYVIIVGKLELTLVLATCAAALDGAVLRDLWNAAITCLPPIQQILFKS